LVPEIFVITVKTFHDRIAHMREQESRFGLKFEFLWPYDAVELTDADRAGIRLPRDVSISSARKHLLAQYRLIESGADFAIVLEDDAILDEDFKTRILDLVPAFRSIPGDWVVNLAGADSKLDSRFLSAKPNELIKRPIETVEGYVINRWGAEKRLAEFEKSGMEKAFDHWLQEVDAKLEIPHFWVGKPLLRQGSVSGEFSTVLDSSRANKPAWFLNIKFKWNVLRRHTLPRFVHSVRRSVFGD
jgi:glycosyl transferase, family 25